MCGSQTCNCDLIPVDESLNFLLKLSDGLLEVFEALHVSTHVLKLLAPPPHLRLQTTQTPLLSHIILHTVCAVESKQSISAS